MNIEDFGKVRIIEIDRDPWFVANDAATSLGYQNTKKAVLGHCSYLKLLKYNDSLPLTDSPRGIKIIPESDVYRLIMRSNLPLAEQFQDCVVEKVLPSLRKHEQYTIGQETMDDEESLTKALLAAKRLIKENELKLHEAIRTKVWINDKIQIAISVTFS